MNAIPATQRSQQGVMLIEALIGILIFSIGILAMMGMQSVAMRTTIDSKYRSEAAYLANQMIGNLWGDRADIATYDTTAGAGNARLTAWKTEVARVLPNASGANAPTIAVVGRQVTLTVLWQGPKDTVPSKHIVIAQINDP